MNNNRLSVEECKKTDIALATEVNRILSKFDPLEVFTIDWIDNKGYVKIDGKDVLMPGLEYKGGTLYVPIWVACRMGYYDFYTFLEDACDNCEIASHDSVEICDITFSCGVQNCFLMNVFVYSILDKDPETSGELRASLSVSKMLTNSLMDRVEGHYKRM